MSSATIRSHRKADALATIAVWSSALLVSAMFGWIILDLVRHGLGNLSLSFLLDAPRDAGRAGGIGPIVVSTLWITAICMVTALPVGIGTAALLAEGTNDRGRFGRLVRRSLDALAAVPSIVFGLFGSAVFCIHLGMGFSILSGGLTLACMVLPIVIRTAEEGIRSVPDGYRQAAAALGISRTATLMKVLLPAAAPALAAGLVLGVGRALAETAALIFTSGYVDRMPRSPFDSGRAMSVHIYDLAMNVPGGNANAHATALVLVGVLLLINAAASWLVQAWLRKGAVRA
ncbi:MAG: phosphate ABC transporter, permease protein PstA [Phycisphaeraceae bacterium]|nr:phosphate ABC transporter, permease protein PstA [Phycisphaeraceae bacterium]